MHGHQARCRSHAAEADWRAFFHEHRREEVHRHLHAGDEGHQAHPEQAGTALRQGGRAVLRSRLAHLGAHRHPEPSGPPDAARHASCRGCPAAVHALRVLHGAREPPAGAVPAAAQVRGPGERHAAALDDAADGRHAAHSALHEPQARGVPRGARGRGLDAGPAGARGPGARGPGRGPERGPAAGDALARAAAGPAPGARARRARRLARGPHHPAALCQALQGLLARGQALGGPGRPLPDQCARLGGHCPPLLLGDLPRHLRALVRLWRHESQ
mmetsp:Transcript_93861/g.265537  ORF Transcript_93861/g.265537 Transcript_93861/m.265537 type:complete len:273 (+) Transcript_93861:1503-2321(+)